ncbi:hypothetical protein THRCLA_05639 [Thraustotheca clavata]|uniref:BEACH domain-containing protein n=1 Tax=Thraustotheca clavata TaxID=74557 RepID=A0A1V9ZVD3_9STRA|nr:hypothetical protein THRCLA_05639 [Thraustotheca clavata]
MCWDAGRAQLVADLNISCCFPMDAASYIRQVEQRSLGVSVMTRNGEIWRLLMLEKAKIDVPEAREAIFRNDKRPWSLEGNLEEILGVRKIVENASKIDEAEGMKISLVEYLAQYYENLEVLPCDEQWMERLSTCMPVPKRSNLIPLLGILESNSTYYLVFQNSDKTLHDYFVNSNGKKDDVVERFFIYQLLQTMSQSPLLAVCDPEWVDITPTQQLLFSPFSPLKSVEALDSRSLVDRWIVGDVSNLEYLLAINQAAGRTMRSLSKHPVLPWVIDFVGNFRDLTKSKFRLMKGDSQLDHTYTQTGHHIPENLSDITVAVYLARCLPMQMLRSIVRSTFEAKEYPMSMTRLYAWSPEECIPELYLDPSVFTSQHSDMMSLELPSPEMDIDAFLRMHRAALESNQVSSLLHNWIDLNFGVALAGEVAIAQKNVPLRGFIQVFNAPHPSRQTRKMIPSTKSRSSLIDTSFTKRAYTLISAKNHSFKKQDSFNLRRSGPTTSTTTPLSPVFGQKLRENSLSWLKHSEDEAENDDIPDITEDPRLLSLQPMIKMPKSFKFPEDTAPLCPESLLEPAYPSTINSAPIFLASLVYEMYLSHPLFTPQLLCSYLQDNEWAKSSEGVFLKLPKLRALPTTIQHLVLMLLHPDCNLSSVQNIVHDEVMTRSKFYHLSHHPQGLFSKHFLPIYDALTKQDTSLLCQLTTEVPMSLFCLIEPLLTATDANDLLAWCEVFPVLAGKLGKSTSLLRHTKCIVQLFENCGDDTSRLFLLSTSPTGFLWLVWDYWGSQFLLEQIIPVLLEWWRNGSPVLRQSTAYALAQLSSASVLGSFIVEKSLLPRLLQALSRPKIITKDTNEEEFWSKSHTPSMTSMAILRVACEVGEHLVTNVILPSIFDSLGNHINQIQLCPNKIQLDLQLEVVVQCKLAQCMLDMVRDLSSFIPAMTTLIRSMANQRPPYMTWVSVIDLMLTFCEKIGPSQTREHLQPSLQACVQSIHCPSSFFAPFPMLEHWHLGVLVWPSPEPLPKVHYEDIEFTPNPMLPSKVRECAQQTWARSATLPKPRRNSCRWTTISRGLVWELSTDYKGHNSAVKFLLVLDDDRWLLSASVAGSCRLWRLIDMTTIAQWSIRDAPITGLAAMPFLLHHFVLSDRNNVYLYQTPTMQCKWQATFPSTIMCNPIVCGSTIIVPQEPLCLHLFQPSTTESVVKWTVPRALGTISTLVATLDERFIIVGGSTGYMTLLEFATGSIIRTWAGHEGKITKLQCERNFIISFGLDRLAHIWDSKSFSLSKTFFNWPEGQLDSTSFVVDGQRLFASCGAKLAILSLQDLNQYGGRVRLEFESILERQKDGRMKYSKWTIQAMAALTLREGLIIANDCGAINLLQIP